MKLLKTPNYKWTSSSFQISNFAILLVKKFEMSKITKLLGKNNLNWLEISYLNDQNTYDQLVIFFINSGVT